MLSSLFAITAVLASFVAANPILAPRAASDPFILFAPIGQDNQYLRLEMKPVANTKYYEFGWFGSGSEDVKLYFLNDEEKPGPVFDNRKNKYEMVFQLAAGAAEGLLSYRALLVDRSDTDLTGLQGEGRFQDDYPNFKEARQTDDDSFSWWQCIKTEVTNEEDTNYYTTLHFGHITFEDCLYARSLRLSIKYEPGAVTVVAPVDVP